MFTVPESGGSKRPKTARNGPESRLPHVGTTLRVCPSVGRRNAAFSRPAHTKRPRMAQNGPQNKNIRFVPPSWNKSRVTPKSHHPGPFSFPSPLAVEGQGEGDVPGPVDVSAGTFTPILAFPHQRGKELYGELKHPVSSPRQSRFNELLSRTAKTVILNGVKNLKSFSQTNYRTRNRAWGEGFHPPQADSASSWRHDFSLDVQLKSKRGCPGLITVTVQNQGEPSTLNTYLITAQFPFPQCRCYY